MKQVIAITGKKGSGKDTSAQHFLQDGFAQIRFADPLKDMLKVIFAYWGYDSEMISRLIDGDLKEEPCEALSGKTPRFAMQTLGTEWRNMIDQRLWTNIFHRRMAAPNGPDKVIVTDCRFPHEQEELAPYGGVLIRIHGGPGRSDAGNEHPSEKLVDSLSPDIEIFNYGSLEDLASTAEIVRASIEDRKSVIEVSGMHTGVELPKSCGTTHDGEFKHCTYSPIMLHPRKCLACGRYEPEVI